MSKHVVDSNAFIPLKDYKRIIFGADSNYPLPRAALIVGIRGDGSVDIHDEFYQSNSFVEQLGNFLISWHEKIEWRITGYHDPSAPVEIERLNNMSGIICEKADNSVIPGISEVSRYFDQNKIRINKTCVNLIRELQGYKWKKNAEGEYPEKENDHLCDALRYALNSIKYVPDVYVTGASIFR
jgi:hypothetical protein